MNETVEEFIRERLAVFEEKHGILSDEAKDCLAALLVGCVKIDPIDMGLLLEMSEDINGDGESRPLCYCERKKR